jgi:plastocyanin
VRPGGDGRGGRRTAVRLALLCGALAVLGAPCFGGWLRAAPDRDDIEVTASKSGFAPKRLQLRKGETVHVVLRSSDGEHCFAVDALRIEKRVAEGHDTSFDLTPDRAGDFVFYCCLEPDNPAFKGRLVVSE